ncbi:Uracil-DNA glycosylase, family 1 [Candidatus Rhodobacter oscarellae]|uniref:Uracil-DNA glycosylase n=1 Tax=Candidatus Rhodobacter oscarellae TaxID=1675527 RepID=A0A0J9E1B1_9RHOB|nr:uracil-DNA glycosylase [Candidatus Rhodobacter lobularis]KMW56671.1 Uracil-DNA glycosylase, family 1 [Candidatus Rhodobacter lobularis]
MPFSTDKLGDWSDLPFFRTELAKLETALRAETRPILPASTQVFAALELCPPADTRVVILGQDPYPTPGHAHGLAFSAEPHVTPLPRSLANIYKELEADLGARPPNADLRFWAKQGVLLLNTVLTVPAGEANGHKALGWQALTHQILAHLDDTPRAFLLWGRPAQKLGASLAAHHLKIETAHPSPLSARRGFFGSRPFSRTNAWLSKREQTPINWTDPLQAP